MKGEIKWGYFDKMRPTQIEGIKKDYPIAYLPWGAIEYHGSHNPTGLDTHKAVHLCSLLAKEVGGLVFPPISLAANLIKSYPGVDFPNHSIEFSEKLIQLICEEYFEQLAEQNFKIIVLLSGHAGEPHLQILRDVASQFNKKYPEICFWTLAEFDVIPDHLLVANHSALGETSLQLYFEPETVDLDCLPKDRAITLEIDAVSGEDPRSSTMELGEKIANSFVENASGKLDDLIKKYI
ncbi:creatininase family protein [Aureibaculum sp. A20]|uniref:Creatininase family protein n=1 Tax=Aureibaculum flavum TaxID=2795986 RepID=A0ABS0WNJ1_9FLAO|nr:creatininase family protein [Aureibaculum flavum]MBJ2173531.1 creatininase family protein [Aureibaculum flavum]